MKARIGFAILFLTLIPGILWSQPAGFYLDTLQPVHLGNRFPVVYSDLHPKVADKINRYLQITRLDHHPADKTLKHPFQFVGQDTVEHGIHVTFYGFEAMTVDFPILSLKIDATHFSNRPHDFELVLNFNALNGDILFLEDLLSKAGMKRLVMEFDSTFSFNAPHAGNFEFYVRSDSVIIWLDGERADGHGYDGTPDSRRAFGKRELQPYLSKYGRSLQDGVHSEFKSSYLAGSFFNGVINGLGPVGLMIDNVYEDGSMSAILWSENDHKLINLSGSIEGDSVMNLFRYAVYHEDEGYWDIDYNLGLTLTNNNLLTGEMTLENGWEAKVRLNRE